MKDILKHFGLPDTSTITPVGVGLINATYQVETAEGQRILQRLHSVVPDAALQNLQVVTDYLASHGMAVPQLLPTLEGTYWHTDEHGQRWRLYPLLPGKVYNAVPNTKAAQGAGRMVGQMHRLLREFNYVPQGSIPHFHDTPYILNILRSVIRELPAEARPLAERVLTLAPDVILNEQAVPAQIIHGDLKISNLLFTEDDQPAGVIDFDTLLFRPRAIDMGDALRSWGNPPGEDVSSAVFNLELFTAAYEGYKEGIGEETDERNTFLRAAKQIAFELTARYLIDVVKDEYFAFNAELYPSRRAHNLARAQRQLHLAESIPDHI